MTPHTSDTIVALASAPGSGARAIIRLTGPDALAVAGRVCETEQRLDPPRRLLVPCRLSLPGVLQPLPGDLTVWPAPRTYTGQDLVEIHTLSSVPLVELLVAALLDAGARAARPGEFTLRAFLSRKLDLTRAEAVLAVVEAGNRAELRHALSQLAGGLARPAQALREELLNLLADVEAGLDFGDEDIRFVDDSALLLRLGAALAQVTLLGRQVERRAVSDRTFRVALAGRPNAGKSSLFNALGGSALVSPDPGTTRDYLVQRLPVAGTAIDLIDTPGRLADVTGLEARAQTLGREQAGAADLVLVCVVAGTEPDADELALLRQTLPPALPVTTQCDRGAAPPGWLSTSALTGIGLMELRALLAEQARRRREPALAPSLSRCRQHSSACLQHLRRAHALVIDQAPQELLALELREALQQLGEMAGAVYTDDLLDRVFSRFCIGK
jgi:tRNA modification GTPase